MIPEELVGVSDTRREACYPRTSTKATRMFVVTQ